MRWAPVQGARPPRARSSPLGLALGITLHLTRPRGLAPAPLLHRPLEVVVNLGRSLPFIVLLVAIIPLTRLLVGTSIGTRAAIVPLVVAAVPYVARVVEGALAEVPAGLVDAARVIGASPAQVVLKVLLPEALPALVRGAALTTISLVSYSAMAGAIGGGGLGDLAIRYGYQRFQTDVMVGAVVVLIAIVHSIQAVGERLARRLDHRQPRFV